MNSLIFGDNDEHVKFPFIGPAIKTGEQWKTAMHHRDLSEPSVHNAIDGRSALLYVSRDAKLTLMYQMEAVWHAMDTKLEDINSSVELLSHAAMGEEEDTVLLVTHDISKRFRLYRITIAWNPTQHPRPGGLPPAMTVAPTVSIGRLTVLDHVAAQHADAARLSQLHILPAVPSHAALPNTPTFPTVLAIFSRASLPVDLTQQHQEAFSVIARWHVESVVPTLHEAFGNLRTNGTATAPQTTVTILRRQEDIFTNRLILSVEPQYFNTMLAFAASDGTIEFRERTTMASIEPYPDPTTVTSLPQSGFEHLMDEHYVHVAMSGDGSVLATTKADWTLSHKMMTLRYTWHPVMDDGGLIEAAVVCLARQYAILCCTSVANDETLALFPSDLSTDMRSLFIKEVIEMLGRLPHIDISMQDVSRQQGTVVREALLPKALSAQFVLGCKPGTTQLTFMGKYAFAFLNVRLVATSLAQLISGLHSKVEAFLRPEFFTSFRGLIRWGSDLLVYIVAGLITIKRNLDAGSGRSAKEYFDDFITVKDSPVIHLLLCTFSRAYLRLLGSCIPKYLTGVSSVMKKARSVSERQQLQEIWNTGTSLPFKYGDFETLIADLDTAIRNVYTQGNIVPDRRGEIELSMICCDRPIPDELQPALQTLLDSVLPKFLEKVDMGKLYFWDTSWLGIEPSPSAHQLRYDIIRKVPITKDMKLKLCRRCGAVTEDMSLEKTRELAPMLAHVGKHCICASFWVVD